MRATREVLAGLAAALLLTSCAEAAVAPAVTGAAPRTERNVQVSTVFGTWPATAVTYDPQLVARGARVAVSSRSADGRTVVELAVRGLQPGRTYGAHVHARECGAAPEDAGPHFQREVDPVQPSVDPRYANRTNEIWLDLTADRTGAGSAQAVVDWDIPGDRRPGSVVVHALPTATDPGKAGTAGARGACVTVQF